MKNEGLSSLNLNNQHFPYTSFIIFPMNPIKKVLAIGPHPDDIELACFGTMCRLADEGYEVHFLVLSRGE